MSKTCQSNRHVGEKPDTIATMLAWMDLEMTGLNPETDHIVEIATLITDDSCNILFEGPDLVIYQPPEILASMNDLVRTMHTDSGLLEEIQKSTMTLQEAGDLTLAFFRENLPTTRRIPLCGNTIGTDRRFLAQYLPEIEEFLHYRSIDVSTIKELAKRWNPALLGKAPQKNKGHRALDDIRESVEELQYFKSVFFQIPTIPE